MASEFLLAYRELIRLADNDPTNLAERAGENPSLQSACDIVSGAHLSLRLSERYAGKLYAHTIPRYEVEARTDYENRWRGLVMGTDRLLSILPLPRGEAKDPADAELDRIKAAIEQGGYEAAQFETLIEYARDRVADDELGEFSDWGYDALRVWDDLRIRTGFNLSDVLSRLELVPFIRIPVDVSNSHGEAETISLFRRLSDAQHAFIFGCYLACAALQRSILEDVLPPGKKVPARIEATELPLPLKQKLHAINDLANDVLHADRKGRLEKLQQLEFIRRLVRGLHTIRELIEFPPTPKLAAK